jgi:hypothetical protein
MYYNMEALHSVGCEWLRRIQLDWHTIKSLNMPYPGIISSSNATAKRLSQLLTESCGKFSKRESEHNGMKGSIETGEKANPKFHKAICNPA